MDPDQHGAPDPGIPAAGPRASDRDRDRALELLATAAGDGRLTLEEYSARADRALAARLVGELSELTADLQRVPEVPAQGADQMVAILSSDSRNGHLTVPARFEARTVLGDCKIELQEAVLTSHVTRIDARAMLGAVTILVPDGVEVRLSGKSILGARSSEVTNAPLPGAPVIEVRATAILGNVTVRPASFIQGIQEAVRRWLPEGDPPR